MEGISAILSSSVVAASITAIFQWAQNRKNNSLNCITEEHKAWRTEIKEIFLAIHKSKYKGKNKKNIERYLVQLQMNINPYGMYARNDYLQDGHIWDAIQRVQESKCEQEFEENKKLLCYTYIIYHTNSNNYIG